MLHRLDTFVAQALTVAQSVPDVAEIRRLLACVKSSVDAGIPVTDGWRILENLLSTAAPQPLGAKT